MSTAHHAASGAAWAYWLIGAAPIGLATQVRTLLLDLPDSSRTWLVLLGLLDASTTILIFVAVRRTVGFSGAALAAALYAMSPWAWVLARDPAPLALPMLAAAALLAAVTFVHDPRAARAALLGLCSALLVRADPSGWVYALPFAATLILARPTRRAFAAGALAFAVLGGPTALRTLGTAQLGVVDPLPTLEAFWWLTSGRASIEPWPAGWSAALAYSQMLALVCGGALLAVGVGLALGADGRRARGRVLFLVWTALPLASLAFSGTEPAVGAVATLLPAATALMALPLAIRPGRHDALVRRAALAAGVVVGGVSALTVSILVWQATSTEVAPKADVSLSLVPSSRAPALPRLGIGDGAALRFWQATADAALDAAERTGAGELTVIAASASQDNSGALLASLLEGRLPVRMLPAEMVTLPIDRDSLYLLLPGSTTPPALSWPSARLATLAWPGADGPARLVSLRPRPLGQWLAGRSDHPTRFADGTALVGVRPGRGPDGSSLDLHWTFETNTAVPEARVAELRWPHDDREVGVLRVELPPPELRRSGELVVQPVAVAAWPNGEPGFSGQDPALTLFDAEGGRVPPR